MSPATIVMICLICVGCAIGIAGLVVAAIHGLRLRKAAKKAGFSLREDVQQLMKRIEALGPRVEETKQRYEVVAERLESLSATTDNLKYLRGKFDQATGLFRGLKF